MKAAIAILAIGSVGSLAATYPPQPSTCTGTPNTIPVDAAQPTFVARYGNATRWSIQPADMKVPLNIFHLSGTPTTMGTDYAMLAKEEFIKIVPEFTDYVENEIAQYLQFLPPAIRKAVEQWGISAALNITLDATREFIPPHFTEMANAIEDTLGFDRDQVLKLSLFPELIKMGCSMYGGWNNATAEGTGLLQLRALDWDSSSPAQQFPAVLNYHPTDGDGHSYSVVGWVGLLGAVSGYSSAGIGLSEKVWLSYDGLENIVGYPATFLLEDILRYDLDTDQALSRIAGANRTCSIFIGLGDDYNNEFKVVQYGYEHVHIWNWRTCPTWENHDRFTDLVFVDKHVQPSTHPCLNDLMHQLYGQLDAAATVYVSSVFETGDTHIAIYDFEAKQMYVSNAAPTNVTAIEAAQGKEVAAQVLKDNKAYNQPFVRFDMNWMWNASLATVTEG